MSKVTSIPLDIRRRSYAMQKVDLLQVIRAELAKQGAQLIKLDATRWGSLVDNQLDKTFIIRNSKNWVNDPKAVNLLGVYDFRSWHVLTEEDMDADVDYYVLATTQRNPAKMDAIILSREQMLKLWQMPQRKLGQNESKMFYFSRLMNGRVGDARFAKSQKHNFDGFIDLPKSVLNNYKLLAD